MWSSSRRRSRTPCNICKTKTQVPFYIKGKKLEDAGVTLDQAITCNLKQVRLSTFLDLKLEELGLVYYDKDGLLVITTPGRRRGDARNPRL